MSINDFLNRVNPKDINKLQLEGLVKAGAFDNINSNRQALFDSIPNFIIKNRQKIGFNASIYDYINIRSKSLRANEASINANYRGVGLAEMAYCIEKRKGFSWIRN